jgi:hypothetical protein
MSEVPVVPRDPISRFPVSLSSLLTLSRTPKTEGPRCHRVPLRPFPRLGVSECPLRCCRLHGLKRGLKGILECKLAQAISAYGVRFWPAADHSGAVIPSLLET